MSPNGNEGGNDRPRAVGSIPLSDGGHPTVPVAETVRDYYEALRRGEPLYPYFAERSATVKIGVGETLLGYDAVAEGLREQSRRTDDWTVTSTDLRVGRNGEFAWFYDRVEMAWSAGDDEYDFDTRWTGSLERRGEEWVFVTLHVSAPHEDAD